MFFEEKIEEINHILEKLGKGKVAVWCLGIHTEKLAKYTELLKYNIDFFIDRNAGLYLGREVYGKTILPPEEVDFNSVGYIVVSTYKYQDEISAALEAERVADKAVTFYSGKDEGEFYLLPRKDNWNFYFTGNFDLWDAAEQTVTGYGDESIVRKVLYATKQVMENKACFERDSVLFYTKEFNFRLISIFGVLASRQKHINILDFGGALGSEYWKNRDFLCKFGVDFTWNIVEQENYVEVGKREICSNGLRFFYSIDEFREEKTDIIILSSVLQYLPEYKGVLSRLMALEPEYILIERQPVGEQQRICVQYVGESIYHASYPMQIIAEKELMDILSEKYIKVVEFDSEADGGKAYVDGKEFKYKGYIMERKHNENS